MYVSKLLLLLTRFCFKPKEMKPTAPTTTTQQRPCAYCAPLPKSSQSVNVQLVNDVMFVRRVVFCKFYRKKLK